MDEYVKVALDRLAVDLDLVRANWTINPFVATAALADLSQGGQYIALALDRDPKANERAKELGVPPMGEILKIMRQAYKAAGIDLSHFGGSSDPV